MATRIYATSCFVSLTLFSSLAMAVSNGYQGREDKNATTISVGSEQGDHSESKGDAKQTGLEDQSVAGARDRADTTGGIDTGDRIPATASRGDPMNTKSSGQ